MVSSERAAPSASVGGAGQHLLERGDSLERLVDSVLPQCLHAFLDRQVAKLQRGGLANDRALEVVVDREELVNGVPAVVARSAAGLAAYAAVERLALDLGLLHAEAAQHVRLGRVLDPA